MLGKDYYISQNTWLIEVENMWKGEQMLKKMVAKSVLPPTIRPEDFEEIRIDQTGLGDVRVFRLKNS